METAPGTRPSGGFVLSQLAFISVFPLFLVCSLVITFRGSGCAVPSTCSCWNPGGCRTWAPFGHVVPSPCSHPWSFVLCSCPLAVLFCFLAVLVASAAAPRCPLHPQGRVDSPKLTKSPRPLIAFHGASVSKMHNFLISPQLRLHLVCWRGFPSPQPCIPQAPAGLVTVPATAQTAEPCPTVRACCSGCRWCRGPRAPRFVPL